VTTPARVLDVARSQIGTVEDARGRQKYGAAYGMDGVAWCAEFQWWCFREAGASALIPKTAYTPTFYSWFQQRGQASRTPRVGSLVFYDFPDSLPRIQHVGIVEAINPSGTITTIEGNTTSGVAGSQDRGGGVWRRTRSQSAVVGYGHPAYEAVTAAPQVAPAAGFDPDTLATLTYGMRNDPRVRAMQEFLNRYNWRPALPLLPATGNYLDQTRDVVRGAQAQCGITGADANGETVGPRTKAAFGARGARW
jgi:CHAP domain